MIYYQYKEGDVIIMRKVDVKESRTSWGVFIADDLFYIIDKETTCQEIMDNCKVADTEAHSAPTMEAITKVATTTSGNVSINDKGQHDLTIEERKALKEILIEIWRKYFKIHD